MSDRTRYEIAAGTPESLGATLMPDGTNFAIYSENADRIELCLFDGADETEHQRLTLPDRTGHIWHGFVPRARAGLAYGYRVHGRYAPHDGHRFNPNKLLIDPYARSLTGPLPYHETQFGFVPGHVDADHSFDARDSAPFVPKARVIEQPVPAPGTSPRTPWRDTVIYELHVKGFSRLHPDIPSPLRGNYAGLASDAAIRHFKSLGITAIELLPVAAFNDEPHLVAKGLTNYWGYNPFCLMAPEPRYASGDARAELIHAIRRLHDAGIEVILDVVFNHTGEGWHLGPTLSLKGIDNAAYYRLDPADRSRYVDHAGCGNTLDLSRPHVRRLLLDSLRTWAGDYGIDGYRFDLASTLGRGTDGSFSPEAETLRAISTDPVLSQLKLIAEPWDCADGGYQLGRFPQPWTEWNDKFRDCFRRFWRGDAGLMPGFAQRLSGSSDGFGAARAPLASINYVTAHDGMRLRDLVSYNAKRNAANGEDNRDGFGDDHSNAYGLEGPSGDPEQRRERTRQMRNMIASLLLAQGVPMLCAGDEIGHSQGGNNNPYCQDNALSWIDWKNAGEEGAELFDFVRTMIAIRRRYPAFRRDRVLTANDATWLSPDGCTMSDHDWELPWARCFGLMLAPADDGPAEHLLLLFNAHDGEVNFRLPAPPDGGIWSHLIDTTETGEHRLFVPTEASASHPLPPRSLIMLTAAALRGWHYARKTGLTALDHLSELAGIAPEYHDLTGQPHATSPETQRALLRALGFDVGDQSIEERSLRQAHDAAWRAPLPPVAVVRLNQSDELTKFSVAVSVPSLLPDGRLRWRMNWENGDKVSGEVNCRDLTILDQRIIEGEARRRLALELTLPVPHGYHRLHIAIAKIAAQCTVIATPVACYQPEWMREGQRIWGVAHQLYALRGESPSAIGDFTALKELSATVGALGGAAVGVNPLHALSLAKPDDASPYAPSSRLFLNPLYIDLHAVPGGDTNEFEIGDAGNVVDYPRVKAQKLAALGNLFARFEESGAQSAEFARFLDLGGEPLRRFAIHQVLEEKLGRDTEPSWDRFRNSASADTIAFADQHAQRVRFHCWLQFEAERQLAAATGDLKLGLYGDLAVGVDPLGADVWAEPEAFAGRVHIGAPPDQFSAGGQDWGLLAFDPHHLRRTAYRPFADMIRAAMRFCGAIRIDHVMWLERMFWVPEGGKPSDGAYIRFPVDDLMAVLALESHRHRCVVIGEDLGTVPAGFRERMHREGILSYKLMRFERYENGLYCRPSTYAVSALATPASHDLPTIAGFWTGRDIEVRMALRLIDDLEAKAAHDERARERPLLVAALVDQQLLDAGFPTEAHLDDLQMREVIAAVHAFLARTSSSILMLNIEDLAAATEQVNLPGPLVGYPCWRLRMDRLTREIIDAAWVRDMLARVTDERSTLHS